MTTPAPSAKRPFVTTGECRNRLSLHHRAHSPTVSKPCIHAKKSVAYRSTREPLGPLPKRHSRRTFRSWASCNETAVFASMIAILRQTPRPHVPQKASLSYAAAGPSRRESSAHRAYSDPKSSAHRACATNFIAASQNAICCHLADNLYRNNAKCLFLQDATKALATIGSLNLVQTHPFQRQSARGCGLRRFVACALSAVRAFLFPVAEE